MYKKEGDKLMTEMMSVSVPKVTAKKKTPPAVKRDGVGERGSRVCNDGRREQTIFDESAFPND